MPEAIFIPYEPNQRLDPRVRQKINRRAAYKRWQAQSIINQTSAHCQSSSRYLSKPATHGRAKQQPLPVNYDMSNIYLWRDATGTIPSPQPVMIEQPTLPTQASPIEGRHTLCHTNALAAADVRSLIPVPTGGPRPPLNTIANPGGHPSYQSNDHVDPNWFFASTNMWPVVGADEVGMYNNPEEAASLLEAAAIVFDWSASADPSGMGYQRYY